MLEVEVKLRLADAAALRARLIEEGWSPDAPVFERNTIYDTPDRQLYASGRLLRVRQIDDRAVVTVKLPTAYDGPHKVREERQFETDDLEQAHEALKGLGYQPAWVYEKRRTTFRKRGEDGVIELDDTPIGAFVEMEGAADWIDRTAAAFGFSKDDYLVDTYRTLFEKWRVETGADVAQMTFD